MATTDKLLRLIALCKCSVTVTVNDHRDVYLSVADWLREGEERKYPMVGEIADDVRAKMVETDTTVHIQYYPNSPVGFNDVWHYDLDAALDQALAGWTEER